MTARRREVGGSYLHHPTHPIRAEDHPQLLAWEAEQDAATGPVSMCSCYDVAAMEYGPGYPCDHCRARDLAEIDLDGADDDRNAGRVA